jgi:hypothetical protein
MSPTTSVSSTGAGLAPPPRAAPRATRPARAARWARRTLFLVHRWLGVALALLMALWTLSGFVMMYVSYPATTPAERVAGLDPLDLSACCATADLPAALDSAVVEMVAGKPVLRWTGSEGGALASLAAEPLAPIGAREAGAIAQTHMRNALGGTPAMRVAPLEVDQWTLQQRGYAPLYKASFADARGTVLYVSGASGEVVQDTHRSERLWNWLGAVPHWLYFTPLRQNGALWSQGVIWTSLLGTFLTLTGLYVGVVMWGRGERKSPFRGVALWHHWSGLIFGLVTLTWVFSGFASMQPWGWLESEGPGEELHALAGRPLARADAAALVAALAADPQPGVVSAEATVQGGRAYAILVRADGSRSRATLPDLAPAPPSDAELAAMVRAARPGVPITSAGLIAEGDAYHYPHHSTPALLPAWRAIYGDAEATRLYFDPRTGELIDFVDSGTRSFRWWHSGLHRLDVSGLRERPLWDLVTLPLLAGVALVCLLGVWMGVRRLTRPFGPLRRGATRHKRTR